MSAWRIAVGELAQETDSFSPLLAGLDEFESYGLFRGEELLVRMRGAGPIGGLFEVAEQQPHPIEWKPLVRAWAGAGGAIRDDVFRQLLDDLLQRLRAAGPVDAVFLALHGAAASQSNDDVEGTVLEAVRRIVGPRVPIVVPLDHHANVTRRMFEHADLLVAHETQPHDPIDTGRKTARLLFQMLQSRIRPTRAFRKLPLITPQDQFLTTAGPMKEWFDCARQWELAPGVLDVSPCPMQPWLDAAEGGWSVVVHTDGDQALAERIAQEMADLAWSRREEFWRSERVSPADAAARAAAADHGLVILSDTGDSVYGGAPGDNTTLLDALLRVEPRGWILLPVVDPRAVAAAHAAGVGAPLSLDVGGRFDAEFSRPVSVTGRVAAILEGVTVDIVDRGVCRIGRSALLECGMLRLVLLEERTFAINHPSLYWHLGVDVAQARAVVVKTASNFQFFAPWRSELIRVDTPGTTQSNLHAFRWQRLPRPIAGLDRL
ncbi:MAG: M81 family metallopeptidase [Pirellulales bacterium]